MTFKVLIGPTWTEPPSYAMPAQLGSPVIQNPPIVYRHGPTDRDCNGRPVGASSALQTTISRSVISTDGLAWWHNTVGLGSNLSTPISIMLFDPMLQYWVAYSGIAWRPTYRVGKSGYKLTDWSVKITNLTRTDPMIFYWYLDTGRFLDTGLTLDDNVV